MKIAKVLLLVLALASIAAAEYPLVPIDSIQRVPLGRDSSFMAGDTIRTGGQVVAGTGLYYAGSGVTFYMENPGGGPFSGIMVYDADPNAIDPLYPGDSVFVTAWVHEYEHPDPFSVVHTELEILPGQYSFRGQGMPEPDPVVITASAIDTSLDGGLFRGEPYESVFIRINNLVCDTAIAYGNIYTWICHDETGTCLVREASDSISGFVPERGTEFEFVQGVAYHAFGGYQLQPRYMRDMPLAAGAPIISNVHNTPEFPMIGDLVTLSANVFDDSHVDTVRLNYRIDNQSWSNVPMVPQGSDVYTYQLPSPPSFHKVDYYVYAVDDSNLSRNNPYEAPGSFYTYIVQQARAMTISEARIDANFDFLPDKMDTAAILTGIAISPNFSNTVTSFFMQQGSAGIEVYWDSLIDIAPGESISVTGVIQQNYGNAEIQFYKRNSLIRNGTGHLPETTLVSCAQLKDTVAESYEGKLVRINYAKIVGAPGNWPTLGSYATMQIVQGADTATMFISQWTDIDGMVPTDSIATIVGVINQHDLNSPYSGYYEFEPRYYSDFTWGAPPDEGCQYTPGDVNNNHSVNGVDIVYAVAYFKGGPNHPPVDCYSACPTTPNPFFAAGDVNGNCVFNGIDLTYFVRYLKLLVPSLLYCPSCAPAPLGVPTIAPDIPPVVTPTIIPTLKTRSTSPNRSSQ